MGYGEYGGGGSIHWTVIHGGDGRVENGRDPEPKKGSNAKAAYDKEQKFIVIVNGVRLELPITGEDSQIQIYWPPHHPDNVDRMQELQPKINEGRRKNLEAHRAANPPAPGG